MLSLKFALNTDMNFNNGTNLQYQQEAQEESEVQTVNPPLNDCEFQRDGEQSNMDTCNRKW